VAKVGAVDVTFDTVRYVSMRKLEMAAQNPVALG
jgi:hypothetical protein